MRSLADRAAALVAPGKGILAADGTTGAVTALLAAAGARTTLENRHAYRELLVTTPGLAGGISGVILSEETLRARMSTGESFPAALRDRSLLAGVTADAGAAPLPGTRGEAVTEGLDGLPSRLRGHARLGARFAVWRATLRIGPGRPSAIAVRANAQALARYAAACQEAGLVPVVAPRVTAPGAHSLGACESVASLMLLEVMSELHEYRADFAGVVVAPAMVLPGAHRGTGAVPAEVAEATLGALNGLPATVAGIAFSAGGQPPEAATANLAAMQRLPSIWPLTFCFGRALAGPALTAWHGDPRCWAAGQQALARRVALNAAALEGRYGPELEREFGPESAGPGERPPGNPPLALRPSRRSREGLGPAG
jgi:fructose-bisphosphate aldolase class I